MLRFEKLQVGYTRPIHTNVLEYEFEQGQLVVLLGRNGCGKTTLLKTLNNSLPPQEGTLYINTKDSQAISAKEKARYLSIVTTQKIQTAYLKVYDLIAMGRYPYLGFLGKLEQEDKAKIDQIIADLGIESLLDKYITNCSDGEQQLILLARALAQDTPIILLDEATAHLDFVNRVKIFQTLSELAAKHNKLLFLATHELEIALQFAHKVILFHNNEIAINSPQHFIDTQEIQQVFDTEGLDYQLRIKS